MKWYTTKMIILMIVIAVALSQISARLIPMPWSLPVSALAGLLVGGWAGNRIFEESRRTR